MGLKNDRRRIDEAHENLTEALELFFECAGEREIERRLGVKIDVSAFEIPAVLRVKSATICFERKPMETASIHQFKQDLNRFIGRVLAGCEPLKVCDGDEEIVVISANHRESRR